MSQNGLIKIYNTVFEKIASLTPEDLVALAARIGFGAVFWLSGRTKVSGFLHVTDGAIDLFRDEYKLPVLPPELAAHLAAYSEHLFSALLILGLFTRFGALSLLGMTAVIEIFVYPDAWPTHLSWAAGFLYLMRHGGGRFSLDHLLRIR